MTILTIDWGNALDVVGFSFIMVFMLLVMIVIVLNLFSRLVAPKVRVVNPKSTTISNTNSIIKTDKEYIEEHLPANVSAAIAMAVHLYYSDVHDEESAIITIKKVEKRYSPWSSKIYGLNNLVK